MQNWKFKRRIYWGALVLAVVFAFSRNVIAGYELPVFGILAALVFWAERCPSCSKRTRSREFCTHCGTEYSAADRIVLPIPVVFALCMLPGLPFFMWAISREDTRVLVLDSGPTIMLLSVGIIALAPAAISLFLTHRFIGRRVRPLCGTCGKKSGGWIYSCCGACGKKLNFSQ